MQSLNEDEFNRLMNLIDKKMTETFGNDIVKGKAWQVYDFMANFEFNYVYLPLNYEIYIHGERWDIFALIIYRGQ